MVGRRALGVALAATAGCAMATQARINGELAERLQDGLAAALLSFGVGLALLAVIIVTLPAGRHGLLAVRQALQTGGLRWWQLLGGVFGGFVVASQGLTVGALGVAVFTVALVAGQSTSSLLVDRAGLAPGGAEPVTRLRVAGSALCVLAVVVAVADRLATPRALALAVLPLLAGVGIAWQQAVNGRVRASAGSTWPATFINFVAGTVALLLGYAVWLAVRGGPAGALPAEPWLYAGGPLGVLVIAVAATVVRYTGVLLLGLAAISGQVVGALALDLFVPAAGSPAPNTYVGAALALVAVMVAATPASAAVPRPRRSRSGSGPDPA